MTPFRSACDSVWAPFSLVVSDVCAGGGRLVHEAKAAPRMSTSAARVRDANLPTMGGTITDANARSQTWLVTRIGQIQRFAGEGTRPNRAAGYRDFAAERISASCASKLHKRRGKDRVILTLHSRTRFFPKSPERDSSCRGR